MLLYTSLDTKNRRRCIGPFKAKYGIDVKYYRGGSNDVTSKVLAESDAGRVQVDMVDASDLASIMLMKDRGLLKTVQVAVDRRRHSQPARRRRHVGTADRLTQAVIPVQQQGTRGQRTESLEGSARDEPGASSTFSSLTATGAPRLYTLAKHLGWDFLKGIAATRPLRVQTPQLITRCSSAASEPRPAAE